MASRINLLALERLDADPATTLVIEDSRNGLLAAINAGLRCVVTLSSYTQNEDMREAALVVSSLGDPSTSAEVFANRSGATPGAYITLTDLV